MSSWCKPRTRGLPSICDLCGREARVCAPFRARGQHRLTETPVSCRPIGADTGGQHGEEICGEQAGPPAQRSTPRGRAAAHHGPHKRSPLPLPGPVFQFPSTLHRGPQALSPWLLQDGTDEELLTLAVLPGAENTSEAAKARWGRSCEESECGLASMLPLVGPVGEPVCTVLGAGREAGCSAGVSREGHVSLWVNTSLAIRETTPQEESHKGSFSL